MTQAPIGMISPVSSATSRKSAGHEQPAGGVVEAQEGFDAGHLSVGEVDDRLVVQAESARFEGVAKVVFDLMAPHGLRAQSRVEDVVPAAASLLGSVHGRVGGSEQFGRVVGGVARHDDADAGGDGERIRVDHDRWLEGGPDPVDDPGDLVVGANSGGDDDELVAADSGGRVMASDDTGEAAAHLGEKAVPGAVAHTVVDGLETVQVEVEHGDRRIGPVDLVEAVLQPGDEQVPVRQAGQRVVHGLVGELVLDPLRLGDVLDVVDRVTCSASHVMHYRGMNPGPDRMTLGMDIADVDAVTVDRCVPKLREQPDTVSDVIGVGEIQDVLSDQVGCVVPKQTAQWPVDLFEPAVQVDQGNADRSTVEGGLETVLRFRERTFLLLALRDVPPDDDQTVANPDSLDGEDPLDRAAGFDIAVNELLFRQRFPGLDDPAIIVEQTGLPNRRRQLTHGPADEVGGLQPISPGPGGVDVVPGEVHQVAFLGTHGRVHPKTIKHDLDGGHHLGVDLLELAAGRGHLPGPGEDLGLHALRLPPKLRGLLVGGRFRLLEAHELGDVLDPMDDPRQLPSRRHRVHTKDRSVDRTPIPSLELTIRPPDVVPLDRHRVRHALGNHPFKRGSRVWNSRSGRVIGIVGKDLEDATSNDLLSDRPRRRQIRLADCHDAQVRRQDEVAAGACLEKRPKVRRRRIVLDVSHHSRRLPRLPGSLLTVSGASHSAACSRSRSNRVDSSQLVREWHARLLLAVPDCYGAAGLARRGGSGLPACDARPGGCDRGSHVRSA